MIYVLHIITMSMLFMYMGLHEPDSVYIFICLFLIKFAYLFKFQIT